MKLVFINIYPDETIARYLLSSYVLFAYISKYYPQKDFFEIKILNFPNTINPQKISDSILKENPDIVSYSCYVWNIKIILNVIENLQFKLSCIQIFGGPDISPEKIKTTFQNFQTQTYFIFGEGERKFVNLLKFLVLNNHPSLFPCGVAYWQNNETYFTPDHDHITNLDEIPSVYLENIIDERLYAYQQAFLETQRGCHFRCKYCVYHKNNAKITYYSEQRIFDELDFLIQIKKIKALRIFDSIFTTDLSRAKNIVKYLIGLKKKQIALPWIYWEFTYNSIDEEFFSLVSELKTETHIANSTLLTALDRPQHYSDMLSGYTAINCIGIQSFSDAALKAVSRPKINKEKFQNFMNLVSRYNLVLKMDMILGLPDETQESYFDGLEYLIRFFKNTDHILNIHRLQMLPGSDLEKSIIPKMIDFSKEAPYYVRSTNCFTLSEMNHAATLTAVLFRIINSPLRSSFFELKESRTESLRDLLESLFFELSKVPEIRDAQLFQNGGVDDNYWNGKIYSEISTSVLLLVIDQMMVT